MSDPRSVNATSSEYGVTRFWSGMRAASGQLPSGVRTGPPAIATAARRGGPGRLADDMAAHAIPAPARPANPGGPVAPRPPRAKVA